MQCVSVKTPRSIGNGQVKAGTNSLRINYKEISQCTDLVGFFFLIALLLIRKPFRGDTDTVRKY